MLELKFEGYWNVLVIWCPSIAMVIQLDSAVSLVIDLAVSKVCVCVCVCMRAHAIISGILAL